MSSRFKAALALALVDALPDAAANEGAMVRTVDGVFYSDGTEWGMFTLGTVPAPANTVAPAVSGAAEPGDTATATTGTWTNSPTSYAYQWQELITGVWTNISGETASTYLTDHDGIFRVRVTATNAYGAVAANSAQFAIETGGGGTPIEWGDTGTGGAGNWPTSADRALMTKIVAANTLSLTQFNMWTRSASTGVGDHFKGLVYEDDGTGEPGALIGVSAPTAATAGGAQLLTASCSITVPPGNYLIGYVCDGGSGSGSETDSGGTATNVTIMLNGGETNYASPSDPAGDWPGSPGPYSNKPALWFDGTF